MGIERLDAEYARRSDEPILRGGAGVALQPFDSCSRCRWRRGGCTRRRRRDHREGQKSLESVVHGEHLELSARQNPCHRQPSRDETQMKQALSPRSRAKGASAVEADRPARGCKGAQVVPKFRRLGSSSKSVDGDRRALFSGTRGPPFRSPRGSRVAGRPRDRFPDEVMTESRGYPD
jgi:hypothetical protein